MLVQTSQGQSGSAQGVLLGNEKGGSGKSTTALHIAVALMKAGQRVATIDLDCRQQSFTRYINNRNAWARRTGLDLEIPVHSCIKLGETMQIADNENSELQQFTDAVSAVERTFDFIVIDTPGNDSYLMRLAHSMADTLVTPINDSFLDFDVLGTVEPATYVGTGESSSAERVPNTRRMVRPGRQAARNPRHSRRLTALRRAASDGRFSLRNDPDARGVLAQLNLPNLFLPNYPRFYLRSEPNLELQRTKIRTVPA